MWLVLFFVSSILNYWYIAHTLYRQPGEHPSNYKGLKLIHNIAPFLLIIILTKFNISYLFLVIPHLILLQVAKKLAFSRAVTETEEALVDKQNLFRDDIGNNRKLIETNRTLLKVELREKAKGILIDNIKNKWVTT